MAAEVYVCRPDPLGFTCAGYESINGLEETGAYVQYDVILNANGCWNAVGVLRITTPLQGCL